MENALSFGYRVLPESETKSCDCGHTHPINDIYPHRGGWVCGPCADFLARQEECQDTEDDIKADVIRDRWYQEDLDDGM